MKKVLRTIGVVVASIFGIALVLLLSCLFVFQGVFVSKHRVTTAVENQGYTDVIIEDKDVLFIRINGCSKEDDASFEIVATNAIGNRVEILACAGWPFKGVTVRSAD